MSEPQARAALERRIVVDATDPATGTAYRGTVHALILEPSAVLVLEDGRTLAVPVAFEIRPVGRVS